MTLQANYALFMFEAYEASGGISDLVMIGTLADCMARAEALDEYGYVNRHADAQVVLLPTLELVKKGEWVYATTPIRGEPITWRYEWSDVSTPR